MQRLIKYFILIIFCLGFLQVSSFAQTNPLDEEIKQREKELNELKAQRIKQIEAEIERMKAEVEKLKGGPSESPVNTATPTGTRAPQNDVNTQLKSPLIIKNTTPRIISNSSTQAGGNPCLLLQDISKIDSKICDIATNAISEGAGNINSDSSWGELAAVFAEQLNSVVTTALTSTSGLTSGKKMALLEDSEKKRTDKQVGATSTNTGTTSLVVKGGAPAIIGWAIENGSMTSAIDGNTITLRLNPVNFARAFLDRQGLYDIKNYTDGASKDQFNEFLKKLNFGFSFDTSRGQETPTFIVSKQQLASWSVRYEFVNQRNPLSDSTRITGLRNQYFTAQAPNIDEVAKTLESLRTNPFFTQFSDKWIASVDKALQAKYAELKTAANNPVDCTKLTLDDKSSPFFATCRTAAIEIIKAKRSEFPAVEVAENAEVMAIFRARQAALEKFEANKKDFLDEVNKGTVVTFEYTNKREVNAPDTSNFRFIAERGANLSENLKLDFTLNAEMTMFNKKPADANVKRIKDFNIALQLDAPLKDIMRFNDSVLSFAFRYTRQQGDVVLPNGVVADGTKGDILFGQAKLTIPIGDTGIRLPFSMTFGNRSEFVKERFTKANFGLTFDLDQLFRFGTFSR